MLDSGIQNIKLMLPDIIDKLNGKKEKIRPILGLFSPLLVEDNYYDLIVGSSAFHHCQNLYDILIEYKSKLNDNGCIMILNETPHNKLSYLKMLFRYFLSILKKSIFINKYFNSKSIQISTNGILYDPYLGDYAMCYEQYIATFKAAGLKYEIIKTPFSMYKKDKKNKNLLVHFILKKLKE